MLKAVTTNWTESSFTSPSEFTVPSTTPNFIFPGFTVSSVRNGHSASGFAFPPGPQYEILPESPPNARRYFQSVPAPANST